VQYSHFCAFKVFTNKDLQKFKKKVKKHLATVPILDILSPLV
jgi:hypothetical protein